ITLQDELDNIIDYIAIHKIRMGDRLQFTLNVDASISDFACPKFILQPIVENSIQHGISKSRKQGIIQVEINESDSHIIVEVYNNGIPITAERLFHIQEILSGSQKVRKDTRGIGLMNVQERIKSFFGEDSGVFVKEGVERGTVFELHLAKRGAEEHAKINDCR